MQKRWQDAYDEAQSTASMSRKERHNTLVVGYRGAREEEVIQQRIKDVAHGHTKRRGSSDDVSSPHRRNAVNTPPGKKRKPRTKERLPLDQTNNSRPGGYGRPASKITPTSTVRRGFIRAYEPPSVSHLPLEVLPNHFVDQHELPPGWRLNLLSGGRREYVSPEGASYPTMEDVLRRLFMQNVPLGQHKAAPQQQRQPMGRRRRSYSCCEADFVRRKWSDRKVINSAEKGEEEEAGWFIELSDRLHYPVERISGLNSAGCLDGPIRYERDLALPHKWVVKTIDHTQHSEESVDGLVPPTPSAPLTLYVSPEDDCFGSKLESANHLESKGHPAVELETLMRVVARRGWLDRWRDTITVRLDRVAAADLLKDKKLAKAVLPVQVEVVKLPEVFLTHPTVRVEETQANETVITDVRTGDFIAQKITYE